MKMNPRDQSPLQHTSRHRRTDQRRLSKLEVAAYLASCIPGVFGTFTDAGEMQGVDEPLPEIAGVTLSAMLCIGIFATRKRFVNARSAGRLFYTFLPFYALIAAFTPVREVVLLLAPPTDWLFSSTGIISYCSLSLTAWATASGYLAYPIFLAPRPVSLALRATLFLGIFGSFARILSARGLWVFFYAISSSRREAFVLAIAAATIELIISIAAANDIGQHMRRAVDVQALAGLTPDLSDRYLRTWADETVSRGPDRLRKYELVPAILTLARVTNIFSKSRMKFGLIPTKVGAAQLIALAEHTVRILSSNARKKGAIGFELTLFKYGGMLATLQSEFAQKQGRLDEALHQQAVAASELTRAGLPNMAALARLECARLLLDLASPDEAVHYIVHVTTDTNIVPWIRKYAFTYYALLLVVDDRRDEAVELWTTNDLENPRESPQAIIEEQISCFGREIFSYAFAKAGVELGLIAITELARRIIFPDQKSVANKKGKRAMRYVKLIGGMENPDKVIAELERVDTLPEGKRRQAADRLGKKYVQEIESAGTGVRYSAIMQQASVAISEGRILDAYKLLSAALSYIDSDREQAVNPRRRQNSDLHDLMYSMVINLIISFAGSKGFPERPYVEALRVSELARSRALLELLAETAQLAPADEIAELAAQEAYALEQYLLQRERLEGDIANPESVVDSASATQLGLAMEEVAATRAALVSSGSVGAEYVQLRQGNPLHYEELQNLLPPNGDAIFGEYFVHPETVLLFIGKRQYPEPLLVEIDVTREFIEDVATARTISGEVDAPQWQDQLSLLVKPLLEHVKPGQLVWLIPHDLLHYVPLHAINIADEQSLIDQNPVCITPSASVMRFCQNRERRPYTSVALFVDSVVDRPLAYARAEVAAVEQIFAGHCVRYEGAEVTQRQLLDAAESGDYDIIHLACHGEFRDEQPLDSGIDLADGARFTARDFMRSRLRCNLAVLSACETGLGQRRSGDELIGLTRAVLYAGAASVLVTLWKVDDLSCSYFMQSFYSALVSGPSKVQAVRIAQLAVKSATVRDVIDFCERMLEDVESSAVRDLDQDIARLTYAAGDFERAALMFDRAAMRYELDSRARRALLRSGAICRNRRRSGPQVPNYSLLVFADPFHWAPFVLVGDWR